MSGYTDGLWMERGWIDKDGNLWVIGPDGAECRGRRSVFLASAEVSWLESARRRLRRILR